MLVKRITILFVTIFLCVGCDRVTKSQAISHLKDTEPICYLGDVFRLQYSENIGAMLSMGEGLPDNMRYYIFVVGVALVLLAGIAYMLLKPLPTFPVLFASLVLGGGLGNLYDRAFHKGVVVDFMNIGIGSVRTGIFNVADVAIMIGAFGLLANSFMRNRREIV